MLQLNFPTYSFRFKNNENNRLIFDSIRKKFVVLTPEEWVRQHVIQFLVHEKNISTSHIAVEKQLLLNDTIKRYDLVVFDRDGGIELIVECKAPNISISQETFDQIARYNLVTKAKYLMVTNGKDHYFCQMDYENSEFAFLPDFPVR
jgi:Type I restriction enzyme R protein N terminus (HSDR_N)